MSDYPYDMNDALHDSVLVQSADGGAVALSLNAMLPSAIGAVSAQSGAVIVEQRTEPWDVRVVEPVLCIGVNASSPAHDRAFTYLTAAVTANAVVALAVLLVALLRLRGEVVWLRKQVARQPGDEGAYRGTP